MNGVAAVMLSSSLGVEFCAHGGCVLVDYSVDGDGETFELTGEELRTLVFLAARRDEAGEVLAEKMYWQDLHEDTRREE